jgi:hypothetical protein
LVSSLDHLNMEQSRQGKATPSPGLVVQLAQDKGRKRLHAKAHGKHDSDAGDRDFN